MKLDSSLIGILIGASLLLTLDLTAQAAGMSMSCADPPARSSPRNKAFRDRMFVRSDRPGLGQVPKEGSGFNHPPAQVQGAGCRVQDTGCKMQDMDAFNLYPESCILNTVSLGPLHH